MHLHLHNVTLRLPAKDKTIKLFLPELVFSTDINKDINGLIAADYIELNKPVISFESHMGASETKLWNLQNVNCPLCKLAH